MLHRELRSTGLSHAWNELKGQWRQPLAILDAADPSARSTSVSRFPHIISKWSLHRISHFSTQSAVSRVDLDSTINPENLDDTLEAHRAANRASLIRRTEVSEQPGLFRPKLDIPRKVSINTKPFRRDGKGQGRGYDPRSVEIYYKGICQPLKEEWVGGPPDQELSRRPWLAHLEESNMSSKHLHDCLNAEILAFEKYMESTAGEKAAVRKALATTRQVIESIKPAIKVSVMGSRGTGLAMPLSDIDINIENPKLDSRREPSQRGPSPWGPEARRQAVELLRSITKRLRKKGGPSAVFGDVIFIDAKVPIIQAKHLSTDLEVQIQSTTDGFASLEMVKAYMDEFPTLRPLFFVLRHMLKMRELGEPREHGIGSYPLIMMIVAALKFSGSRFDRKDAGRQLLYFLDFYSKIDFRSTGIAVDPPELFSKVPKKMHTLPSSAPSKADFLALTSSNQPDTTEAELDLDIVDYLAGRKQISIINEGRPYLMCLQDPASPFNDLGIRALAIQHVQATFHKLRSQLKKRMERYESESRETSWFSMLDVCLAGDYGVFTEKRRRLQRVGEKFLERPVVATYL